MNVAFKKNNKNAHPQFLEKIVKNINIENL